MNNGRIGVGIVGVEPGRSWSAIAHVPALRALDQFDLVAVSTRRAESAAAAARALGVPRWYDNAFALVSDPEVDLVTVAVKVPHHRELVAAALAAGKMVYCEWPLGKGLDEAMAMAEDARRAKVRTAIGLQGRFSSAIRHVRDLVRDGYAGEVLSTTFIGSGHAWGAVAPQSNAYLADKASGATVLTIPFGHAIDALCYCLGEFETISATMTIRHRTVTLMETGERLPVTSEDQVIVGGVLKGGAAAAIHFRGGKSRGTNLLWEINGTDGDLQVTSSGGSLQMAELKVHGGRGDEKRVQIIERPASYRSQIPDLTGPPLNVAATYAQFAADLANGTRLCPDFDAAVARHRLLDSIEKVAHAGPQSAPDVAQTLHE
jgi:predicted dehydrogenase